MQGKQEMRPKGGYRLPTQTKSAAVHTQPLRFDKSTVLSPWDEFFMKHKRGDKLRPGDTEPYLHRWV